MLAAELKRFVTELCVSLALLMMLVQTYPAFSSTMSQWTPICSGDGIAFVQLPSDDDAPKKTCKRCTLCFTNFNSLLGLPAKSADIILAVVGEGISQPQLVSSLVVLPDHLLPFSGAPPPYKQVDLMMHTVVVSVSLTPNNVPVMPETVSWH